MAKSIGLHLRSLNQQLCLINPQHLKNCSPSSQLYSTSFKLRLDRLPTQQVLCGKPIWKHHALLGSCREHHPLYRQVFSLKQHHLLNLKRLSRYLYSLNHNLSLTHLWPHDLRLVLYLHFVVAQIPLRFCKFLLMLPRLILSLAQEN